MVGRINKKKGCWININSLKLIAGKTIIDGIIQVDVILFNNIYVLLQFTCLALLFIINFTSWAYKYKHLFYFNSTYKRIYLFIWWFILIGIKTLKSINLNVMLFITTKSTWYLHFSNENKKIPRDLKNVKKKLYNSLTHNKCNWNATRTQDTTF